MKSKPDLLYILVIILGLGIAISSYAGVRGRVDAQEILAQSSGILPSGPNTGAQK